jgi:hypothetical protein
MIIHNSDKLKGVVFNKVNITAVTSDIFMDNRKKYVLKKIRKYKEHDCIQREVYILNLLKSKGYDWVPELVYTNNTDILVTRYIGIPVNSKNIPSDYKEQYNKIMNDMKEINMEHNDIKQGELLIKGGKIYLCDYGWVSINDNFSCGTNISNKRKPSDKFRDINGINILDTLFGKKKSAIYLSEKRDNIGSQKEIPNIQIKNKIISVSGYQKYNILISERKINYYSKVNKYDTISKLIFKMRKKYKYKSLSDIGCSSGIVSYIAHFKGYKHVYAYDHDQQYLDIINTVNNKMGINTLVTQKFSFGDKLVNTDVIVMCALIHWIYSCTALFGNFDSIFTYLKDYINSYLIIEWVDITDSAVKSMNHISFNKEIHTEEYTRANFERSLKKNIGTITSTHPVSNTRILYCVQKNNEL